MQVFFDLKPWKVFSLEACSFGHGSEFWTFVEKYRQCARRNPENKIWCEACECSFICLLFHIPNGRQQVRLSPTFYSCLDFSIWQVFLFLLGFLNMQSMTYRVMSPSYRKLEFPLKNRRLFSRIGWQLGFPLGWWLRQPIIHHPLENNR